MLATVLPPWPVIITVGADSGPAEAGPHNADHHSTDGGSAEAEPHNRDPHGADAGDWAAPPIDTDSASEWSVIRVLAAVYLGGVALMALMLAVQWRRAPAGSQSRRMR